MDHSCPLVRVSSAYILEACPSVSDAALRTLETVIAAYLRGEIDALYTSQVFFSTIGTTKPVDRINRVLTVADQPLPSISSLPLEAQTFLLKKKSRPWTEYEDLRLLAAIHKFGLDGWGSVAQFVGNSRTKAQCCQRWTRGLDPKISKIQWTQEEDRRLLELVAQYGQKSWTKIASEFGNRCDVQCRYRFKQLNSSHFEASSQKLKLPPIQTLIDVL